MDLQKIKEELKELKERNKELEEGQEELKERNKELQQELEQALEVGKKRKKRDVVVILYVLAITKFLILLWYPCRKYKVHAVRY